MLPASPADELGRRDQRRAGAARAGSGPVRLRLLLPRGAWAGTVFWGVHATCGGWWFDKMEPGGWNPAFATRRGI